MKIKVTKSDIKNGKRDDPRKCAIALAIIRNGCTDAHVDGDEVSFTKDNQYYSRDLSAFVQQLIIDVDNGVPVEPFEFEVKI